MTNEAYAARDFEVAITGGVETYRAGDVARSGVRQNKVALADKVWDIAFAGAVTQAQLRMLRSWFTGMSRNHPDSTLHVAR